MATVSVVIATYNRSEFVTEAIKSAKSQTYDEMEIIIVDDGSTDGTRELLRKYEDKPDVHVLYNDENRGQCYSKNRGAAVAEGKYLAFLDDDDQWHSEKISHQIEQFHDLGEEYAAIGSAHQDISNDGIVMAKHYPSADGDMFPEMLISNHLGPVSTVLLRASAFDTIGMFADDCPPGNDWEMYIRLAQDYKIGSVKEILVDRRLHGDNISGNPDYDVTVRGMVWNRYSDTISSNPNLLRRFRSISNKECGLLALEQNRRREALIYLSRSLRLNPTMTKILLIFLAVFGPRSLNSARNLRDAIKGHWVTDAD